MKKLQKKKKPQKKKQSKKKKSQKKYPKKIKTIQIIYPKIFKIRKNLKKRFPKTIPNTKQTKKIPNTKRTIRATLRAFWRFWQTVSAF